MRIVLIHLGSSNSDYLWANVEYLSKLAPSLPIDVVTSKESEGRLERFSNPKIEHFQHLSSPTIEKLMSTLQVDSNYREGFWRYTIERLLALTEHHNRFPSESLLHIESDVLLLNTFPFRSFVDTKKIAWSSFEKDRDVASIIYLPNHHLSAWLQAQLLKLLQENLVTTDMHLLSLVSKNNDQHILSLPIAPNFDSIAYSNNCGILESDKAKCSQYAEKFDGVFDAAAIGIWLTGTHPVNAFGMSTRYDTNLIYETRSFIDPSKIDFQISREGALLWTEGNESTKIHTLHIHSKNLDFFSSEILKVLEKCVMDSRKGKVKRHFSVVVLLSLINDNWRKGTLLRYLSWLPGIRRIKFVFNKFRRESDL